MSDPYVIWTLRRTGGTTLGTLLSRLSEHPSTQHEPFNKDRVFAHVSQGFAQSGDVGQLRGDLRKALAGRPVIKHCYELMSPAFDAVFLEVTTALGYRHIVLDRRRETDRIISLELAYLTGAWGSDAARDIYPAIEAGEVTLAAMDAQRATSQMRMCHNRRSVLAQQMTAMGQRPFVVYFEDVYADPQAGAALIGRLLAYLGIRPEEHPDYEAQLSTALLHSGQNSARILQAVPNLEAVRTQLETLFATQAQVFAPS